MSFKKKTPVIRKVSPYSLGFTQHQLLVTFMAQSPPPLLTAEKQQTLLPSPFKVGDERRGGEGLLGFSRMEVRTLGFLLAMPQITHRPLRRPLPLLNPGTFPGASVDT